MDAATVLLTAGSCAVLVVSVDNGGMESDASEGGICIRGAGRARGPKNCRYDFVSLKEGFARRMERIKS